MIELIDLLEMVETGEQMSFSNHRDGEPIDNLLEARHGRRAIRVADRHACGFSRKALATAQLSCLSAAPASVPTLVPSLGIATWLAGDKYPVLP